MYSSVQHAAFIRECRRMSQLMSCKVDRARSRYELQGLDERLKRRYGRGDEVGVRDLEEYLNRWILRRAMDDAGMISIDGEVDNFYRLLTDDDVSAYARDEARRELERSGVDVDDVLGDFVSYQTVRKHLNECLGVDTSRPDYEPSFEDAQERIGRLSTRIEAVVARVLARLRDADVLTMGEPKVSVHLKVRCGECARTHNVGELLQRRGCPCAEVE